MALLRRLRSLFSVASMGGDLEVVEAAKIDDKVILSVRLPEPTSLVPKVSHWLPGSVNPLRVAIPAPLSNDRIVEIPWEIQGPAGIHYFDLIERESGKNDTVIARAACAVSER